MEDSLSAKWHASEQARMRLVRLRVEAEGSVSRALDRACSISKRALGVARVSVWVLSEDEGLRCVHALDSEVVPEAPLLSLEQLGRYDAAMRERRVLAASDVAVHPVTSSLVDRYFDPFRITATVDAPIYRDGRLIGMVCHEHRGGPRDWTDDDASFAISVGDIVASLFASAELRAAQDALREKEAVLRDAMSWDALGRVARGVAHDVNNVLAVVFTAVSVLERVGGDSEHRNEATEAIRDAAESATRLVKELLAFGRPPSAITGERAVVDDAIAEREAMLRRIVGERTLVLEPGAPSVRVAVGRVPLEQVLDNLMVNARDATVDGGIIAVRTRILVGAPGERSVILEIEDDGAGMDGLTQARMFEPFFSTKQAGSNSGFGLAIVDGVVRASGGRIEVESAPGKGTRIRISFPIVE